MQCFVGPVPAEAELRRKEGWRAARRSRSGNRSRAHGGRDPAAIEGIQSNCENGRWHE